MAWYTFTFEKRLLLGIKNHYKFFGFEWYFGGMVLFIISQSELYESTVDVYIWMRNSVSFTYSNVTVLVERKMTWTISFLQPPDFCQKDYRNFLLSFLCLRIKFLSFSLIVLKLYIVYSNF